MGFNPIGDGGTLFDLGDSGPPLVHNDDDARNNTSESSLSQYSTPSEGASDDSDDDDTPAQQVLMATGTNTGVGSPHVSNGHAKEVTTNPKLRGDSVMPQGTGAGGGGGLSWWKKVLEKLKRLQVPMRARWSKKRKTTHCVARFFSCLLLDKPLHTHLIIDLFFLILGFVYMKIVWRISRLENYMPVVIFCAREC